MRRKEHLILKQAQEIIELKQKLLLTQNLLNEAKHDRRKKTDGESHVALSSIVSLVMLNFCATRCRRHHSFEKNRIEVQE